MNAASDSGSRLAWASTECLRDLQKGCPPCGLQTQEGMIAALKLSSEFACDLQRVLAVSASQVHRQFGQSATQMGLSKNDWNLLLAAASWGQHVDRSGA